MTSNQIGKLKLDGNFENSEKIQSKKLNRSSIKKRSNDSRDSGGGTSSKEYSSEGHLDKPTKQNSGSNSSDKMPSLVMKKKLSGLTHSTQPGTSGDFYETMQVLGYGL